METEYYCLGIDLGTTFSRISSCHNSPSIPNPEVFSDSENLTNIPSIVSLNDTECLVGTKAQNEKFINVQNTFYNIKKLIGRQFNDPNIRKDKTILSYKIYQSFEKIPELRVLTQRYHDERDPNKPLILDPEEISALILSYLKKCANSRSTHMTNKCVITVPANFTEQQRRATKDAARIAGLDPIDVISEPIAASIMYAYLTGYKPEKRNVLVYDYGGGTLDVSLVQIEGSKFTVLSTAGNSHLGGSDIDSYLCEHIMSIIHDKYGIDIHAPHKPDTEDPYQRQRALLLTSCEEAKIVLSSQPTFDITIPSFMEISEGTTIDLTTNLTVDLIEQYFNDNKDNLIQPIHDVISKSDLNINLIDDFILMGGSCRIPSLQKLLDSVIQKEPYIPIDSQYIISQGASLYGAIKNQYIQSLNGFSNYVIQDCTPVDIGILKREGTLDYIIPRNTPVPYKGKWIRFLSYGHIATIIIFEGNSSRFHLDQKVGDFLINIEKDDRSPFYIRIEIDKEKNITLSAVDSEEEPNESDVSLHSLEVRDNKVHYTDQEITLLHNKLKSLMHIELDERELMHLALLFISRLPIRGIRERINPNNFNRFYNYICTQTSQLRQKESEGIGMNEQQFHEYIREVERHIRSFYRLYERNPELNEIIERVENS